MAHPVRSLILTLYEHSTPEFFMPTKLKPTERRTVRGRPEKLDKDKWVQVTCVIRRDTVERLREGADSKHFGEYLQKHLDRYPPPTREEYLSMTEHKDFYTDWKGKKVATIYIPPRRPKPILTEEEKRAKKEAARKKRDQKLFDEGTKILMRMKPAKINWKKYDGAGKTD